MSVTGAQTLASTHYSKEKWLTLRLGQRNYKPRTFSCIKRKVKFKKREGVTSVDQLVGHHSAKQKVTSYIPGGGTSLDVGLVPGWSKYKRQQINVSLSH